jgi:hypothetical protein
MYHSWSFRIPLQPHVAPETVRVLEAVARDTSPAAADLSTLHPVVAYYLADWTRLLTGEHPPYVGSPVRLSRHGSGNLVVAIEFSQHDDEFANGGYVLWAWALRLAVRPRSGRILIGHHAFDRDDLRWDPVVVDATGVDEGRGDIMSWADIDQSWTELSADPSWSAWGSGIERAEL